MDRFTICYLIIVNLLGLLFMGLDKKHARSKGHPASAAGMLYGFW